MSLFGRYEESEESQRLAAERRARFQARQRGAESREVEHRVAEAKRHFLASPAGLARTAKRDGQRWFQIEMPVIETTRTASSMLFGEVATRHRHGTGQGAVLTAIESEGWELFQAGFVFHETGQVSRDKLLSSGQSTQTTGVTMGVYLFKATDASARDDEPWVAAVHEALQDEDSAS